MNEELGSTLLKKVLVVMHMCSGKKEFLVSIKKEKLRIFCPRQSIMIFESPWGDR